MQFSASLDKTAWIITTIVVIVVLVFLRPATLLLVGGLKALHKSKAAGISVLVLSGLEIGTLLVTLLFAPMKYAIEPAGVTVFRLGPNVCW
jgi:energy-coupling factor transporter transmembrane protein EcfT